MFGIACMMYLLNCFVEIYLPLQKMQHLTWYICKPYVFCGSIAASTLCILSVVSRHISCI